MLKFFFELITTVTRIRLDNALDSGSLILGRSDNKGRGASFFRSIITLFM